MLRFGSVCSGIEAASVAWLPLGWECVFVSEIDPFACAVLKHRFPDVPNLGDFTQIKESDVGPIDVLVGGTPCQSFSVAGKRAGLGDPRGVLAFEFLRLVDRLRPRWVVFENVPGLRSSGEGRDFGAFLGGLADIGFQWGYRSLDAQYAGLAQRRERVFVVGHPRNGCAAAVLFERASLSGHPPPRRETGQSVASTVNAGAGRRCGAGQLDNPLTACVTSRQGKGADSDGAGIVGVISAQYGEQTGRDTENGNLVYQCQGSNVGDMGTIRSGNGHVTGGVPFLLDDQGGGVMNVSVGLAPTIRSQAHGNIPIAFSTKDYGADAGKLAPTVRAMGHTESHPNGGGPVAVAFQEAQTGVREYETAGSIRSDAPGTQPGGTLLRQAMAVRRLTPREIERLFGFPDDWTLVPYRGKQAADGPRYRALGNSMAVPVIAWIGRHIQMVDEIMCRGIGKGGADR